jgi:2-methylisocitrate lyase-like PEP mutase family enzyme
MTVEQKRADFRRRLESGEFFVIPGAHNGLTGKIIEKAGFPAVYMSGAGVANTLFGLPDVGLITLTEMTMVARCIAQAVNVPVLADADAGYGNAIGVARTIREYEATGVAGIQIEDQVAPKRCGNIAGKEMVSVDEMVGKIRAACDARTDPNFLIIGRTDCRTIFSFDEAVRRGKLLAEAGADIVYGEGLKTREEFREFAQAVPGTKMMNMGGYARVRTTPKMPLEDMRAMGFGIVIFPLAITRAATRTAWDFAHDLRRGGTAFEIEHIKTLEGHPVESWYEFTGVDEIREREEKYLPAASMQARYAQGDGYVPTAASG